MAKLQSTSSARAGWSLASVGFLLFAATGCDRPGGGQPQQQPQPLSTDCQDVRLMVISGDAQSSGVGVTVVESNPPTMPNPGNCTIGQAPGPAPMPGVVVCNPNATCTGGCIDDVDWRFAADTPIDVTISAPAGSSSGNLIPVIDPTSLIGLSDLGAACPTPANPEPSGQCTVTVNGVVDPVSQFNIASFKIFMIPKYTLNVQVYGGGSSSSVSADPPSGGQLASGSSGITRCTSASPPSDCTETIYGSISASAPTGPTVALHASPGAGYAVNGNTWSGVAPASCNSPPSTSCTTIALSPGANMAAVNFSTNATLTVAPEGSTSGTGTGRGTALDPGSISCTYDGAQMAVTGGTCSLAYANTAGASMTVTGTSSQTFPSASTPLPAVPRITTGCQSVSDPADPTNTQYSAMLASDASACTITVSNPAPAPPSFLVGIKWCAPDGAWCPNPSEPMLAKVPCCGTCQMASPAPTDGNLWGICTGG